MDHQENDKFSYTYSAKEQDEINGIRKKYLPKEEDKMERLRRLDAGVAQKANAVSIIVGIVGALILGFGMSLAMTDLGAILGLHSDLSMLLGVVIGVIGIVCLALAYPLYQIVLKRECERIAPEILRLTDELMK